MCFRFLRLFLLLFIDFSHPFLTYISVRKSAFFCHIIIAWKCNLSNLNLMQTRSPSLVTLIFTFSLFCFFFAVTFSKVSNFLVAFFLKVFKCYINKLEVVNMING